VTPKIAQQRLSHFLASFLRSAIFCASAMYFIAVSMSAEAPSATTMSRNPADHHWDSLPLRIEAVEGRDIRFRRLSASAGLSQTRVAWVVQDNVGFIWFGTQYGLNRYDGYKSKIFKHEPGRPETLSCVYIRSLFVDHAGNLWVGCERFLDRFEPATETFAHYGLGTPGAPDQLSSPIERIGEDRAGVLWLATEKGLYGFEPGSGRTIRYIHDPKDPASIADNRINMAGEDREGRFWVASGGGLEEFDRNTGRVVRRAPVRDEINRFHEDASGLFWMAEGDTACGLATWDPRTGVVKCHSINYQVRGTPSKASISEIVEDRRGTLWFSSTGGLLKLDRAHNTIVRYHNNPADAESLESDSLIFLYQDHEGNIWTCFQVAEPDFFSEGPQPFENFTYARGSLIDPLVTSIYEDRNGILWIGSMGGLNRIDRSSGKNTASPRTGNEILAFLEDPRGVLFCGTFHEGLKRIDRETGKQSPYSPATAKHSTGPVMRLIYDHAGNLWGAEYRGLGRFDPATGMFTMYTPDNQNTVQYQEIKEGSQEFLWLGGQTGLHRFDPRTHQFKIYEHNPDSPHSLSDNRVNSIHFDHRGTLWVGTQNGLDRFDPASGTFQNYYEKDGLAGDVVSCILEDGHGVLWMGTNNGLSSFDPQSRRFQNFSAADGLPGQDLTGWGACSQSPSGEMFFGGFSGATAFYPSRLANRSFVPRTVLTDFRLSGNPVPIGSESPLRQSITNTDSITLSHRQNIFSIEFSALSFFNAETNRYRYRLVGLENDDWHQVGSDQRTASYTTLPAGTYTFEVQGATSRGPWSEPGARLRIQILPAWYQTFWFQCICLAVFMVVVWAAYLLHRKQLEEQFNVALEARVDERTRIARELHDTLLQSFNGLLLRFQAVSNLLPARPDEAKRRLDGAIEQASEAITEGRDAVHILRAGGLSPIDLSQAMTSFANELLSGSPSEITPSTEVQVEGTARPLNPIVRDEVYRIGAEALRNAIRHAHARRIEVEIRYSEHDLRLRIRDDGKGIDPVILAREHAVGHWGLRGMRERAKLVGGTFEVWSQLGAGTEIELKIPAASAYAKSPSSRWSFYSRFLRSKANE
jgi:signal transduction histidine kinase/ligand-binding sensor domain-containing protein